ncbi:hypothetical protein AALC17_04305 [Oscillospiraceae bacterium 38-13]
MKRRMISILLAAALTLALCTPALAAPAKSAGRWKVYVENGSIHYTGLKAAEEGAAAPVWKLSWLPEGWALDGAHSRDGVFPATNLYYVKGEEYLELSCNGPSEFSFQSWLGLEAGKRDLPREITVQGYRAVFCQTDGNSALAWENAGGVLFLLLHKGSLTQADMERIAGGVVEETDEAIPEYRLGWTPEQEIALSRSVTLPGYVRDIGGRPDFIRFAYARQPLHAPEKKPEAVTVRGIPARLWLGDPKAECTVVASAATGKAVELPTEETWSVLHWTDPETGIRFCIQGHKLSKAVMLRMAESVVRK